MGLSVVKDYGNGLLLLEPKLIGDERGYFTEIYKSSDFAEVGIVEHFCQENLSLSQKNVLRGLHFQVPPFGQSKLVTVLTGSVLDVVLDIRKESDTYGKWYSVVLEEEKPQWFYVPEGFAHGFCVLKDNTRFMYKVSSYYNPSSEQGIAFDDESLGLPWPKEIDFITSNKDKNNITFAEYSKNPSF
jgi:dTDP-4-dehydrorhamnose 3,5-epimerase